MECESLFSMMSIIHPISMHGIKALEPHILLKVRENKGKIPENLNRIITKWANKYKKDMTIIGTLRKNKKPLKKIKGADQ